MGVYVLNGLLLPVELFAILRLVNDPEIMGEHVNRGVHNWVAWGIAVVVSLLSVALWSRRRPPAPSLSPEPPRS